MTWLELIIAILATYRAARMVAWEEGPWSAFVGLRSLAWRYVQGRRDSWVYKGLTCPLCVGWWVAGLIALGYLIGGRVGGGEALLIWHGIAGGAVVVHQLVERGKE